MENINAKFATLNSRERHWLGIKSIFMVCNHLADSTVKRVEPFLLVHPICVKFKVFI